MGTVLAIYGGQLAALTAAFFWAVASLIYRRAGRQIPPLELNLLKGVVALALFALTLLAAREPVTGLPPLSLALMLLGGAVGIGVGDTAYFASLNRLGPRRALLLGILAPPMAALIARAFLGEALSIASWAGLLLTVGGVAWVVTERTPDPAGSPQGLGLGVALGFLSALAQAGGMVLSRAAFLHSTMSPVLASCLRLAAGILVLLIWIPVARRLALRWLPGLQSSGRWLPGLQSSGRWLPGLGSRRLWAGLLLAILIGTYLAIWLQQVSLKLTSAGIAQTLFSTSPLFILPLAAWTGEKVSTRAVAGAALALGGVALLLVG